MAIFAAKDCYSTQHGDQTRSIFQLSQEARQSLVKICDQLKTYGVHSVNRLKTTGFIYTKNGDTTRCESCDLEVSGWTREMEPFEIHRDRSPNCPFVRSVVSRKQLSEDQIESVVKRQKTDLDSDSSYNRQNKVNETTVLRGIRRRTFSNWDDKKNLSKEQMIRAGFFHCNVADRVICLYCNLICQQWEENIDDPVEVHKVLSPHCGYVQLIMPQEGALPMIILNEASTNNIDNGAILLTQANRNQFDQIVLTSPCHPNYASIPSRQASFTTWNTESSPSIDELVRAGFFYAGVKNSVTCFFCDGSLQNWSKSDDPLIEHIRWYSLCSYAKQLAGSELYNKVQGAKRIRQEQERAQISTNNTQNSFTSSHRQIPAADERLLVRLVAARLDLFVSQRLLDQPFKLQVIKRCWEDQLRLKQDDFTIDSDLYIACLMLQKQIEHINGNKDNITIPSKKMQSIRDNGRSSDIVQEPTTTNSIPTTTESMEMEGTMEQARRNEEIKMETTITVNNPCILCRKEEKRLACIPCGHLVCCVSCSQTLRTCPVCRRSIEAFVRIFI